MRVFGTLTVWTALFLVWIICSGVWTPVFILAGAFSSWVALLIAARMGVVRDHGIVHCMSLQSWPYFTWLVKEVALASLAVARQVWKIKYRPDARMEWLPAIEKSALGITVYANSITLTPGTVTLDVKDDRLLVHALTQEGMDALRSGEMAQRVADALQQPERNYL